LNSGTLLVVYYDENNDLITRNGVTTNGVHAYTVPTNAKYVRFRCDISANDGNYVSYRKG
jgi:hypothetical protein